MDRVIIWLNCFSICVRKGMSMDLRMLIEMQSQASTTPG